MLGQLAQCEFTVRKSQHCRRMIDEELSNYKAISKSIDTAIEQTKHQIEQNKDNLAIAKQVRKNKMEYDVLAKVIKQQPDRKEMAAKLETLKKELEDLKNKRGKLDRKMENRRNDFMVLMRSINEITKKLEATSDEEGDSTDVDNDCDNDDVMSVEDEGLIP